MTIVGVRSLSIRASGWMVGEFVYISKDHFRQMKKM